MYNSRYELMHSNSWGSGSHSPFPIQVAVLLPLSTRPVGQVKWTVAPCIGRPLYATFSLDSLLADGSGYPQFAAIATVYDTYVRS